LAAFVRAHAVVGLRARERGLLIAERGAKELVPDGGAALQSAVTGSTDGARAHLAEAAEVAGRTGDGTFAGLYFGPRNVGVWRVALALELGEPGRVAELAREVGGRRVSTAMWAAGWPPSGVGRPTPCRRCAACDSTTASGGR
jgi:hypothetical protein